MHTVAYSSLARRYRVAFVMEQTLGHITHSANLMANVSRDPTVEAHWAAIPFETASRLGRLPLVRSNWTLRAGLLARRALKDLADRGSLDALFIHTQVPAVLAWDWLSRYPSVVSLDATPEQYDELGSHYQHRRGHQAVEALKRWLNYRCFHLASHLVTWSDWARRGLINGYGVPEEKVTVIPPGVTPSDWARPYPRASGGGTIRVLFVGGDFERKGGSLLLNVFREMRARAANLRGRQLELHLVTRANIANEPGVTVYNDLEPNSEPLKRLYHDCDLFCLPTYGDCLPMVLSEAGCAGLPTISTRLAGIPEIVVDGETGLLIPVGDRAALARALARLVEDDELRLRLGRAAAQVVAREFDASRNAARLLGLIKETALCGVLQGTRGTSPVGRGQAQHSFRRH